MLQVAGRTFEVLSTTQGYHPHHRVLITDQQTGAEFVAARVSDAQLKLIEFLQQSALTDQQIRQLVDLIEDYAQDEVDRCS